MNRSTDEGALGQKFRIACWPPPTQENSYFASFYGALQVYGVEWVGGTSVTREWLYSAAGNVEGVHFHWPAGIWDRCGKMALRRAVILAGFYRYLRLAGKLGLKRIWTVHDLEQHEGDDWADWIGVRVLAQGCDLIICHSNWTAEQVRRRFRPRGTVVVMPLGNYVGCYPEPRNRASVLDEIGLNPCKPTICCLGNIRNNKGLEIAVDAVRRLAGRVQLIIAGPPHREFDVARLRRAMQSLAGGVLIPELVSRQRYADLLGASDAAALPYLHITTSGALLSALSLSRSVIASDLPYFREICEPEPNAVEYFRLNDPTGMAQAIDRCLSRCADQRRLAARRLSDRYAWQKTIIPVGEIVQAWTGRRDTADRAFLRQEPMSELCISKES